MPLVPKGWITFCIEKRSALIFAPFLHTTVRFPETQTAAALRTIKASHKTHAFRQQQQQQRVVTLPLRSVSNQSEIDPVSDAEAHG